MNIYTRLFLVLTVSLSLLVGTTFAQPVEVVNASVELTDEQRAFGWNPQQGDWLLVNVIDNTLQIVREDYSKVSKKFEIGSGRNNGKMMHYLGRTYDPATPMMVWEIRSKVQQNWFNVFGSKEANEQLFLRLYEVKGDQRLYTSYGIHTVPNIEDLLVENDGYNSWGCILTRYQLLKFLEVIYDLNDGAVRVVTNSGDLGHAIAMLREAQ